MEWIRPSARSMACKATGSCVPRCAFSSVGGDDLEVIRNPMLELTEQVFVDARRVVELPDGLNQPFGQHDQERREEQEAHNFEGGVKANRERENLLREGKTMPQWPTGPTPTRLDASRRSACSPQPLRRT